MTAHLSRDSRERYSRRTLRPWELLAADDHLAACADCRQALTHENKTWRFTVARLRRDLLREADEDQSGPGRESDRSRH